MATAPQNQARVHFPQRAQPAQKLSSGSSAQAKRGGRGTCRVRLRGPPRDTGAPPTALLCLQTEISHKTTPDYLNFQIRVKPRLVEAQRTGAVLPVIGKCHADARLLHLNGVGATDHIPTPQGNPSAEKPPSTDRSWGARQSGAVPGDGNPAPCPRGFQHRPCPGRGGVGSAQLLAP